ncbi:unnamed protein product [Owenia fusiformis]|uniref:Uncharacterized protein n=1 Tax=Owenia fusiformis TaxID=6347 RepID=A0A8J1YCS4_OWEFU|nr:unnamed protein product [Owenia fusiformis]
MTDTSISLYGTGGMDNTNHVVIPTVEYNFTTVAKNGGTTHTVNSAVRRSEEDKIMSSSWELGIRTILCTVSLIANVVSIIAIAYIPRPWMYKHYLYLMINLSVADILGTLSSLLSALNYYIIQVDPYTWIHMNLKYLMVFAHCTFVFSYSVSALVVLSLALCRYISVCHPFNSPTFLAQSRIIIAFVCLWIAGAVITIPLLIAELRNDYDIIITFSNYVVPSVLTLVAVMTFILCIRVFIEAKKLNKRLGDIYGVDYSQELTSLADNNAVVTTVLLTTTLLMSALPYWITMILFYKGIGHPTLGIAGDYFIKHLPVINFISDPIIYSFRTRDIKIGYKNAYYKLLPYFRNDDDVARKASVVSRDTQQMQLVMNDDVDDTSRPMTRSTTLTSQQAYEQIQNQMICSRTLHEQVPFRLQQTLNTNEVGRVVSGV